MTSRRRGFSAIELVVGIAVSGVLAALLVGGFVAACRRGRAAFERATAGEAIRVAGLVLRQELRTASPRDVIAGAPDSLALRVLRGVGVSCDTASGGARVRFRGARLPEPDKDSLILVTGSRDERITPLRDAREEGAGACRASPDERVFVIRAEESIPVGRVLLLFERGSYHLADRALRYRRGAGGRQPLTATVVDTRASAFAIDSVGEARVVTATIATALSVRLLRARILLGPP